MGYTLICTLTTHLYLTNPYLVLLQCYNASHIIIVIFCCLSIKAHFTVTHFFLYVVFLAVNLWWYHTVMTFLFTSSFLLLWLSNSGNSKARWEKCPSYNICLIGRNKKGCHLTCQATYMYSAPTHVEHWCLPLCQSLLKFWLEAKRKDPFWFLLPGI